MNRSVLLVICDFFILTLLSFVQLDRPATTAPAAAANESARPAVSAPAMSNMVATLEAALELEKEQRDSLTNALAMTRAELDRRLRLLAEREQNLTQAQQKLAQSESEAKRLAEERGRLERAQAEAVASVKTLQQAFESTQKSTSELQGRLSDSTREAADAKARLEMVNAELKRRQDEAQSMEQKIAKLDESREVLRTEKQRLELNLKEIEVEARQARSEVTNLNTQLASVTAEKVQLVQTTALLATNVSTLAEQSSAIQEQIEKQIRLPANTIYGEFLSNRIEVALSALTRGALGQEVPRERKGATVLFRSGGAVYAALHIDTTPLRIWPPDAPWSSFAGSLSRSGKRVEPAQFGLLKVDPRIVLIPVDASLAASLGGKIYDVAPDASQFAEAVVVGAEEKYYGETAYRLSAETPGYIEMERSTFRRILGEFSPKRGDLVLSRTGLVLGIMVNGDHCLLLDKLETLPSFRIAPGNPANQNNQILRTAFGILEKQPYPVR